MSNRRGRKTLAWAGLVGLLAALLARPVASSSAGPFRQTATASRPTITLTPLVPTPNTATPAPPAAPVGPDQSPALSGFAWINGNVFTPAAGVPVRFAGDGFELATLTDASGYYQFAQVGQDMGVLNISSDGSAWKASAKDVALSVPPGVSLQVNFSASEGTPEVGPKLLGVSVNPSLVGAGQTVTVIIKAINSTHAKLSGVWLTHALPDGLSLSGAATDRGDALTAGRLAMADLGDLAPGDSATFTIVALAPNAGGPQGGFAVTASLFSREGVAVQASTSLTGMGGPAGLPVTGLNEGLVWIGLALAALLIGAHQARRRRRQAA